MDTEADSIEERPREETRDQKAICKPADGSGRLEPSQPWEGASPAGDLSLWPPGLGDSVEAAHFC